MYICIPLMCLVPVEDIRSPAVAVMDSHDPSYGGKGTQALFESTQLDKNHFFSLCFCVSGYYSFPVYLFSMSSNKANYAIGNICVNFPSFLLLL